MPITFAQPDPLVPQITAGAAAAEYAAKTLPAIDEIYANAARLRAQGGSGGGGGRGGGGSTGGYVQVLPRDDGGALYQVEAQANREQRADDLGFEAIADPVARHIKMQEDFRQQQNQQAQAHQDEQLRMLNPGLFPQNRGNGPTPVPQPPPATFTPEDQQQLNAAGQIMADATSQYQSGKIPVDAYYKMRGDAQQQFDALTQKQQAAEDAKKQQAYRQAVSDQAHQRGLLNIDMQQGGETGYRQIPDLPTPIRAVDKHTGKIYTVNEKEIQHVADAQKQARDFNGKLQIANITNQQKTEEAETRHDREDVVAAAGILSKAKDKSGASIVPEYGKIEELANSIKQRRLDSREQRGLEKNANPQIRAAFVGHIGSLPQTEDGKPDWNAATDAQLMKTIPFLQNPGKSGIMKKEANESLAKIQEIAIARDKLKKAGAISVAPDAPAPTDGVFQTMLKNYAAADHSK